MKSSTLIVNCLALMVILVVVTGRPSEPDRTGETLHGRDFIETAKDFAHNAKNKLQEGVKKAGQFGKDLFKNAQNFFS